MQKIFLSILYLIISVFPGYASLNEMLPGIYSRAPRVVPGEPWLYELTTTPSFLIKKNPGEQHFMVPLKSSSGEVFLMLGDSNVPFLTLASYDAERIGVQPNFSDSCNVVQTHEGTYRGMLATLPQVAIGCFTFEKVQAWILENAQHSLLGSNILNKMNVIIKDDTLILSSRNKGMQLPHKVSSSSQG